MTNENARDTYEPQEEPGSQAPPPEPQPQGPPPRGWRRQDYAREVSYGFDPRTKNAVLACFLSLMPGLGQIYVGFYQRGFLHILIVGSIISFLAAEVVTELAPLLGLFLAFFWLYNIIDAGRRAGLYNHAIQSGGSSDLPVEIPGQGGSAGTIFGGFTLITLGVILLAYTRFDMSLRWIEEWWPVAPIIFGAWLVLQGVMRSSQRRDDA